jgi:hypothetical protein
MPGQELPIRIMIGEPIVVCVNPSKFDHGIPVSKLHPLGATVARSLDVASDEAERGVASIPLVNPSEPQAAVFNLSLCISLRKAMLR